MDKSRFANRNSLAGRQHGSSGRFLELPTGSILLAFFRPAGSPGRNILPRSRHEQNRSTGRPGSVGACVLPRTLLPESLGKVLQASVLLAPPYVLWSRRIRLSHVFGCADFNHPVRARTSSNSASSPSWLLRRHLRQRSCDAGYVGQGDHKHHPFNQRQLKSEGDVKRPSVIRDCVHENATDADRISSRIISMVMHNNGVQDHHQAATSIRAVDRPLDGLTTIRTC